MNYLDIGIIIAVVIFVVVGLKRGLLKSIISNFTFKTNLIITFFLCKPVSAILNKIFNIKSAIYSNYYAKFVESSADFSKNLLEIPSGEIKGFIINTLESSPMSSFANRLSQFFLGNVDVGEKLKTAGVSNRNLADIMSSAVAEFFNTIISVVVTLVLIYILVIICKFVVNKIRQVKVIKIVDNVFGSLYGIVRCLLIFAIVCVVIKVLSSLTFMRNIVLYINSSAIGGFIYTSVGTFLDNYLNFDLIAKLILK